MPEGMDARRVSVYSELIFNNVSALLSDFFPVIKSLLTADEWRALVRDFFIGHQAETPYFPKVAEEFVHYLSSRQQPEGDLPFLLELAHYEWVELHLYTHEAELPEAPVPVDALMTRPLALSDLVEPLAYRFPVHRISPAFVPTAPADTPTHLMVFRDAGDSVRFFELQPLSFEFLAALRETPGLVATEWLTDLGAELEVPDLPQFVSGGETMLRQFNEHRIFRLEPGET